MSKPLLTILCGPPGAGKSTLARSLIDSDGDHGAATVYVNQDTQDKFHLKIFNDAIISKKDIIVDRMGFNKQQRNRYLETAKKAGYSTKIIVLHESRYICLDRCRNRKDHPTIKNEENAQSAINMFFSKYERPTEDEADVLDFRYPDREKSDAILVDIDGTIANIDHRLHYVQGEGKRNWQAFFANMNKDVMNDWCKDIVLSMKNTNQIVFCSGRPDNYREITEEWLKNNGIHGHDLFMRPRNDSRSDEIVKQVLLDFEILTRYTPKFVIDDRPSVCRMWRSRGLTVLQVNDKEF